MQTRKNAAAAAAAAARCSIHSSSRSREAAAAQLLLAAAAARSLSPPETKTVSFTLWAQVGILLACMLQLHLRMQASTMRHACRQKNACAQQQKSMHACMHGCMQRKSMHACMYASARECMQMQTQTYTACMHAWIDRL